MKKVIKIIAIQVFVFTFIFLYFMLKNNIIDLSFIDNSLDVKEENEIIDIKNKDELYKSLEKTVLNGKKEFSLINKSLFKNPDEIFKILETISYNNPKVMYYKGASYSFGKLELLYSKPRKEILKHQKEIKKVKENFLKRHIKQDMSDYEKVLEIHDFIINKGEYDKRLINNQEVPPESYSSYGILVLGVGVCESYAKSMKYLLDGVGIESVIVVGESRGENHAWNLVKLDGEYYHVDSTWDDPISEDGEDTLRYNFFNLNDEELSITHEWDKTKYPAANGEKYNYFVYNDLIVNDENQLKKEIENAILEGKDTYMAKILNFDENIEINNIVENLRNKHYKETKFNVYYYSMDKEKGIVSIKLFYNL